MDFFTSSASFCLLIPPDARHPVGSVTLATKVECFFLKKEDSRHHVHTKVGGGQRNHSFIPPMTPGPFRKYGCNFPE